MGESQQPAGQVQPHGGVLVDRWAPADEMEELQREVEELPRLPVDRFTAMDALNIAVGAYSPLTGFLGEPDFEAVTSQKRLASGLTWTVPVLLHVPPGIATRLREGAGLALVGSDAVPFAIVRVTSVFEYSRHEYAERVFGTAEEAHPGVDRLNSVSNVCVGGPLTLIREPPLENRRYFFRPSETRSLFAQRGWRTVAAFHTRNVPHRAHEYLQRLALETVDGLFIHPIVGWKKSGDFSQRAQFEAYEALIDHYYRAERVLLGGFYCQVRYAGPREAVFHAIVRQNFGCTHIIIGRDHAGVGKYYGVYASQQAFDDVKDLQITPLRFSGPFYCRHCEGVVTERTCRHEGDDLSDISGTLVRQHVSSGSAVPHYLLRPEVLEALQRLATEEAFVR